MPQTWSTSAAPPAGQFACWRELICEAFLALSPESDLRDGFAGRVTQWPLGRLDLARIASQRQRVRRTGRDIARARRPGYYANLQITGASVVAQQGRRTVLEPGDLTLLDTDEPFTMDFPTDFRQLSLFLPRPLLTARTVGPVPTAVRVDTATGVGAAVRHALTALTREPWSPDVAARLAVHTAGLLAVALAPADPAGRGHAGSARSRRGATAARSAALADIEEHLSDEDLSPATTARRLGVSVRTVHAAFAGSGTSWAGAVRRRRLDRARRALADPALRHLRIIDIAADAGFGTVAGFHRSFRRAFGRTPGEIRPD
ncbi:helix-turn-helix domain-containing protein [Amorphoplanes nipponensis]|uniref:AraC family transcriptional regulator n=1 Tax=Actinoplanes nipponensis TaxID=135950 RepID=A0A919JH46_9ACTN|nr:helix-turn-helix domain-containing protein [Actinoplanes nipponensis]GIE48957.1 AraC family transcriptional regulator [Actinoplanes nipponensis]